MATIRDVAQAAGVSMMTASRVAREQPGVKKETRDHVLEVMNTLGYQPDQVARALRSGCSNKIGLVVSDVENEFYTLVISKIDAALKEKGLSLLISFSNENPKDEYDDIAAMLSSQVDGIIFTPVTPPDERLKKLLEIRKTPIVQLYRRPYQSMDSVIVDDAYGANLATRALLDRGHRKILLLDVTNDSDSQFTRTAGYNRAFFERKLLPPEGHVLYCSLQSSNASKIAKGIQDIKPTAIVAGTNILGFDIVHVCQKMRLQIPEDISVIVHDDIAWLSLLGITAISQPLEEIAQTAVRTLLSRIQRMRRDGDEATAPWQHSVIKPKLVMRQSVSVLK